MKTPISTPLFYAHEVLQEIEDGSLIKTKSLGYFYSQGVAQEMAIGKGILGGNGQIVKCPVVVLPDGRIFRLVSDKPIVVASNRTEALRELARQKLTTEEAEAVGLCPIPS